MLGPFATASRRTPPVLHCHSPDVATVARRLRIECPQQHRQQRQRVTEGTAMAPWNGPNKAVRASMVHIYVNCFVAVVWGNHAGKSSSKLIIKPAQCCVYETTCNCLEKNDWSKIVYLFANSHTLHTVCHISPHNIGDRIITIDYSDVTTPHALLLSCSEQ